MIAGTNVQSNLCGTPVCTAYPIQLGELEYAVYDTPGIDATELGTDPVIVEGLQPGVRTAFVYWSFVSGEESRRMPLPSIQSWP